MEKGKKDKKDQERIRLLIEIGHYAEIGKICKYCGRNFKKAVGYPRLCKKCEE